MKPKFMRWLTSALICATVSAVDAPRGTVPKAAADQYRSHALQDGIAVGATLLSAKDLRHAFSTQVNECCLVIEVALYPQKDGLVEISLNDFALRIVGQDVATKPSSAEVVAGKLHRRSEPKTGGPDVTTSGEVGVGYGTGGIDPVTGRPTGRTVSTGGSVGVGIGGPPEPKAGSTEADLRSMELELREKGLPEGNAASPVAGYVYFTIPPKKNKKYQFEYMLNGNKVVLAL